MKPRRNAIRDPERRRAWALDRSSGGCQVCGGHGDWRGLSVHHLLPGRCGRSDEECNLLLVCAQCHDLCEGKTIRQPHGKRIPTIPIGMALAIKLIRDYDCWDSERLRILCGTRLPTLLPPHPWVNNAYSMNHPHPYRPWRPRHIDVLAEINTWVESYEIVR